jgi:two-component system copper resistance phosphate regulon response regulator CusR
MRLLVVEDDSKLAAIIRQGLEEHGHLVDLAGQPATALALAGSTEYDSIVLDVRLPRQSGFDVLQQLRRGGSRVPVLILTALSSVEDRIHGLDLGADDYLAKPFDLRELLARLRAITRRPAVAPITVLKVADLELDPARMTVTRGGRRIELTATEFRLLGYLMRKQGVVVTRGMILEQIWNMEYDGGSNLVEVYINYLRRKIDQDAERKLIYTVRGAGYVLREPEKDGEKVPS